MSTNHNMNRLVESIVEKSRGWIESATIVSGDAIPIAHNQSSPYNQDMVVAVALTVASALSSVIELLNTKGFHKINIQLEDNRYVIIRRFEKYYVVCITKPNPNLGFVEYTLDTHLSSSTSLK